MEKTSSDGILWFCAGAALGATIALLYAPHPGHHTRRKIGKVAKTGVEKVADSGRQMAEIGKDLYEKGRQLADDATSMLERGRKLIDDPELGEEA